jgi:stearoyl-CoA desaturase (Delta-9 desaturase)
VALRVVCDTECEGVTVRNSQGSISMGLHYRNIAYLGAHHLLALYALWTSPSWTTLFHVAAMAQAIGMLGITAGAHRLWSHRSYVAALPVRILYMLANSAAHQGSIYHWVRDHRLHHRFSDTDKDPHNIGRGFFYAHVGWLLEEAPKRDDMPCLDDLKSDSVVMFQKRNYPVVSHLCCFVLPTFYGMWWGHSLWRAYLYFGVLRWVALLHATWCVNSVSHMWGMRPYRNIPPSENLFTALVAVGEGWHNFHHAYPFDYRASEIGLWNPTTVWIDLMAALGLVWGRKAARL